MSVQKLLAWLSAGWYCAGTIPSSVAHDRNSGHNLQREFRPGWPAIRRFKKGIVAKGSKSPVIGDHNPAVIRIHEIHSRHVPIGTFRTKINVGFDGPPASRAITRDIKIQTAAHEDVLR